MFTGLITDLGEVVDIEERGDRRLVIRTGYKTSGIDLGASIACNGICLTVVAKGADSFSVDASKETIDRTTLGDWRPGTRVNLERSLKLGDELGGHLVAGHVDTTIRILEKTPEGDSTRWRFAVGEGFGRYVAPKGSVALDGVSLTVNEVADETRDGEAVTVFGVNIIPHTAEMTSFGTLEVGGRMNLEVDMLARYVARLTGYGSGAA